MRLTVHEFITLDGVVQSPGAPDEDPDGGFAAGGWLVPFVGDDAFGEIVGSWFARTDALLYGRFTYEAMAGHWPHVTDPDDAVARTLNEAPKHVVSTSLADAAWGPVTVHPGGDPVAVVRRLKEQPGGELQVHGCARLAAALHAAALIDEYRLLQAPVAVGPGKRLFGHDAPATRFEVADERTTSSGLLYRALRPVPFRVGRSVIEDGRSGVALDA